MKAFLLFLFSIIIFTVIVYFTPALHNEATHLLTYNACNTPLPYKIGAIDDRFGLTQTETLRDIIQATNIWDTTEKKNLFTYSPTAHLTINFIYDQRQALNTTINELNTKLNQNDTTLKQQIADYKLRVAAYQQELNTFNQTVEKYNEQGGISSVTIYNQLLQQQKDLNTEADNLNTEAKQLNISTSTYNTNVSVLNGDINQFRSDLQQKPEEGLYNGNENTITIYLINNQSELLHVLAHEFGHALGMEHVKDPQAIMYPYTTSSLLVTTDDIQQLAYVCRDQSAILHYLQEFNLWFFTEGQLLKQNFSK